MRFRAQVTVALSVWCRVCREDNLATIHAVMFLLFAMVVGDIHEKSLAKNLLTRSRTYVNVIMRSLPLLQPRVSGNACASK